MSEKENEKNQKRPYLKAMPLRDLADIEVIKCELNLGNILILKITPLARKNVEDVKNAINELSVFTQTIGGDISRLGEERVVIVPNSIKIWRQHPVDVTKSAPNAA